MSSNSLHQLMALIAKLPGLGQRSARRIALHLLQNKSIMQDFSELLELTAYEMKFCSICSNLDSISPCSICTDDSRDTSLLCVVEGISDLWALERSQLYRGLYHVLGGTLSAINGKTPESLNIDQLKKRFAPNAIKEVIIATNATLEGESTGHYIANIIEGIGIKATRLAHGIPMGAELDHMDDGTLTIALRSRQIF